ncbi:MAG: hypothetical protein HY084_08325 [Gemmatimonadetes bacterium]|nr:hypothetical protein [Gemmatimonadota bacterium]
MTPRGARSLALAALLLPPCAAARAQRADAVVLRLPARAWRLAAPMNAAPFSAAARARETVAPLPLTAANATTTDSPVARPDLEPARVAGELLVGSYGGITGFFLGHYAGRAILDKVSNPSESASDQVAFATGVVGAWIGTTVGVYAIGNIGNQTGSLGTTAFGAGLGTVAGAFLDRLVFAPRNGDPSAGASAIRWGETIVESFLPSIGATIAFNSSRKYK